MAFSQAFFYAAGLHILFWFIVPTAPFFYDYYCTSTHSTLFVLLMLLLAICFLAYFKDLLFGLPLFSGSGFLSSSFFFFFLGGGGGGGLFEEFLLLLFMFLLLPQYQSLHFCFFLEILLEACCDLVEPVMGHSPLLWTATSLSYVNFIYVWTHYRAYCCLCF